MHQLQQVIRHLSVNQYQLQLPTRRPRLDFHLNGDRHDWLHHQSFNRLLRRLLNATMHPPDYMDVLELKSRTLISRRSNRRGLTIRLLYSAHAIEVHWNIIRTQLQYLALATVLVTSLVNQVQVLNALKVIFRPALDP